VLAAVKDCRIELSELGELVQKTWLSLPEWFAHVTLDHFVIMPNHIHAILQLTTVGSPLGTVIGSVKSATSRLARRSNLAPHEHLWQRGFFDHIIRSEVALFSLRQYIEDNPAQWHLDQLNSSVSSIGATHGVAPTIDFGSLIHLRALERKPTN
jgi:REP element-mobilizing transposase RayT